jgi:hypothetical protein
MIRTATSSPVAIAKASWKTAGCKLLSEQSEVDDSVHEIGAYLAPDGDDDVGLTVG